MLTPDKLQKVLQNAELLHDFSAIETALDNMAAAITQKLQFSHPIVLSVMLGALIPTGHLLTRLNFPLQIDYIQVTRYQGTTHSGDLHWLMEPRQNLQGRTVLIIDDVFETGITLSAIYDYCRQRGATAIYTAVLVNKLGTKKPHISLTPDFSGLTTDDRYIFGFGLDYEEYLRNLPGIYAVGTTE